jgi:uroporphyrin-III C-methyltransferase
MDRSDPSAGAWCPRVGRVGRVALVGAGPGDPGLLTRRAAELLAGADVVLHDALVGPGVLALVGPAAELVDVGKRKGHGCDQRRIDELLVAHARRGAHVVRLKGGDPFLFGRGGEEAAACAAAGIEVEVVPGVSAALAAPALAGIPVTHRGVSASVTVVSGHLVGDGYPWEAIVRAGGTLVVLMAATTAGSIAAELLAAGLGADVPVAVVAEASRPEQQVLTGDVADLARRAEALPGPCVVVIGAVAARARTDGAIAVELARNAAPG